MTLYPIDPITQPGEMRHRRTLLALDVAGLSTALAGVPGASGKKYAAKRARNKAKRKARKQCDQQVTTCLDHVARYAMASQSQTCAGPSCCPAARPVTWRPAWSV